MAAIRTMLPARPDRSARYAEIIFEVRCTEEESLALGWHSKITDAGNRWTALIYCQDGWARGYAGLKSSPDRTQAKRDWKAAGELPYNVMHGDLRDMLRDRLKRDVPYGDIRLVIQVPVREQA